jgi:hypothetical protein
MAPRRTVRIVLPAQLQAASLRTVLRGWPEDAARVELDFACQRWVLPSGTVGLSCMIAWARGRGQAVTARLGGCENAGYWERMGFFRLFDLEAPPPMAHHPARGRFSEIRRIEDIREVDPITEELVAVTNPDPGALRVHGYLVSEALNNVCQHSGAVGFCASQAYPSEGTVRFAIGDCGCGLREALADHAPADDAEAIELALRVGVTGRSRAAQMAAPREMRNKGVGLSAITKLVAANRGSLLIWTGSAVKDWTVARSRMLAAPHWQGVLLAAKMPRVKFLRTERDVIRELIPELQAIEKAQMRRPLRRLP